MPEPGAEPPQRLHARQIDCLRWAVAGKSYADISQILGIAERTVRYHLERVREFYGFATIVQALIQAAKDYDLDPYDGRYRPSLRRPRSGHD